MATHTWTYPSHDTKPHRILTLLSIYAPSALPIGPTSSSHPLALAAPLAFASPPTFRPLASLAQVLAGLTPEVIAKYQPTLIAWGAGVGVAATLFLSSVPIFKADVLDKIPVVRSYFVGECSCFPSCALFFTLLVRLVSLGVLNIHLHTTPILPLVQRR